MNLDGMAISVVAYNQPKHLYVALDSLSRIPEIGNFPVTIYVDGPLSERLRLEQALALACYPQFSVIYSETNLGIRGNVVRSIKAPIENGAKSVLYIEDDHIIRADAIEMLADMEDGCFFTGLSYCEKIKLQAYAPKGNLINAENARLLFSWIDSKAFVGLPKNPAAKSRDKHDVIDDKYVGHDMAFNSLLHAHDLYCLFPKGYYLAHAGLFGSNFTRHRATPELLELYDRMFQGPKESWLDNIVSIMESGDYPREPAIIAERLWPRGFKYYGKVLDRIMP